jgi:hypothetical protein
MGSEYLLMKNLLKSLLAAQSEITNPIKNASNPHFRNRYADLSSVLESVQEPLNKQGLVLTQTLKQSETGVLLVTTLWHAESGESMESWIALNPAKTDPQGYAAACTYYRRLSIKALCGLAEVDDDGNEASKPAAKQVAPKPSVTAQKVAQKVGGEILDVVTLVGMMNEAKDLASLNALAAKAKGLPEADKQQAREAYAQRIEELEATQNA